MAVMLNKQPIKIDIFVVVQNIVAIAFYEGPSSIEIITWVKHFIVSLLGTRKCDTPVDEPLLLVFVKETSSQHEPIMMFFCNKIHSE